MASGKWEVMLGAGRARRRLVGARLTRRILVVEVIQRAAHGVGGSLSCFGGGNCGRGVRGSGVGRISDVTQVGFGGAYNRRDPGNGQRGQFVLVISLPAKCARDGG